MGAAEREPFVEPLELQLVRVKEQLRLYQKALIRADRNFAALLEVAKRGDVPKHRIRAEAWKLADKWRDEERGL